MTPVINPEQLLRFQKAADAIHVADALLDYLQNLLEYSRVNPDFNTGLSPRAGLAVLNCARAWALMHGQRHVLPEDVQAVLPSVISHRLYALAPEPAWPCKTGNFSRTVAACISHDLLWRARRGAAGAGRTH